jgi:RNA polymerase sigma-70 factor (ECF subfamily)
MDAGAADRTDMTPQMGHDERFRQLYESQLDDLKVYCLRRLGRDEAEDALAEIFAVAWRKLEKVPAGNEARLWLYGVARNVVRNSMRSARRRARLGNRVSGISDPPRPGPAETTITRSEHADVLVALSKLRPGDQELLRLHAWEELSRSEIASVFDISISAVDMRLHRAIARMSVALDSLAGEASSDSTRCAEDGGGRL